ncbi:hypothetical protein H7K45_08515 [Mycobacterium yunnanensis]|uniref:Lipoprotein n=1 Tax=Mycobacterium yunnanensis TaxID=368477 RepID=A0A9X2Z055_9MYCO|nr:hypothetical protein [Mycobacterium yunnanensis]MCV7420581.1 hypothetical protein [Mycobacterium yunnanensis]
MKQINYAAACAAVVATMTACGAGISPEPSNVGQAVTPTTTVDTATPCGQSTKDALRAVAQRRFGGNSRQPFSISEVRCVGDWAKVIVDTRSVPDANPPSIVLYHYDGNGWRAVLYGSGFNCTNEGVPPSIAAELAC